MVTYDVGGICVPFRLAYCRAGSRDPVEVVSMIIPIKSNGDLVVRVLALDGQSLPTYNFLNGEFDRTEYLWSVATARKCAEAGGLGTLAHALVSLHQDFGAVGISVSAE